MDGIGVCENQDTEPRLPWGYRIARVPTTPRQTNTSGPPNFSGAKGKTKNAAVTSVRTIQWVKSSVTGQGQGV